MKQQPNLKPRLRMEIAEMAHESRVWVEPGPDDWFSEEIDISRFVTRVDLQAPVGEATRAQLSCVLVDAVARSAIDGLFLREYVPTRFVRLRRWWIHHGLRLRSRIRETTAFGARARRYAA